MNTHLHLSAEQMLDNAGLRITAVRLMIYQTILQRFANPFALSDIEQALPTVDRSTLFRNLHALTEAALLHHVDDGSGVQKYCVCHCDNDGHHNGHVHITCTQCHRTYCLTDVPIPQVPLPKDFMPHEHEYIVKGLCAECQKASL